MLHTIINVLDLAIIFIVIGSKFLSHHVSDFTSNLTSVVGTKLINKCKYKELRQVSSKLKKLDATVYFAKMSYDERSCHKLKNLFKKHNIQLVFSNNHKLKNLIGNNLDKIEDIKKSGIYSINCSDCTKVYIGQTKRNILTRFKEHMYHIKCKNIFKSALASHWHETGHKFEQSNLKLIKSCYNKKNLNIL